MASADPIPYGTWPSSISSELIVAGATKLLDMAIDGSSTEPTLYWTEGRAQEDGRYALMSLKEGGTSPVEVSPPFPQRDAGETGAAPAPVFNVRTRVHEYGGAPMTVGGGRVFYSNFADQRLYEQRDGKPVAVTAEGPYRYADGVYDSKRNAIFCVREDHTQDTPSKVVNTIVRIDVPTDVDGNAAQTIIASGSDFYSSPRLSANGKYLAYVKWNHPNMPWDNTALAVVALDADESSTQESVLVVGNDTAPISVMEPQWSPDADDNTLYFISDASGFWNIWRAEFSSGINEPNIAQVICMDTDIGGPAWMFGNSSYTLIRSDMLVFAADVENRAEIVWCSLPPHGKLPANGVAYTEIPRASGGMRSISQLIACAVPRRSEEVNTNLYFIGGSARVPSTIFKVPLVVSQHEVRVNGEPCAIKKSFSDNFLSQITPGHISDPIHITYTTRHPPKDTSEEVWDAHGYFYAPTNSDVTLPPSAKELPPLLVKVHGGPTASTAATFRLDIQYWTSRGFAVFDCNHGGSTGYGKKFRQRLRGVWGQIDIIDVCAGAAHLVAENRVDPKRICIDGGSAGGFTTLAALTFQQALWGSQVFTAGASLYGVSDLSILAAETHKFESRYLDRLVGPYPQAKDIYEARSPLKHTEHANAPIIFFQGTEDKIVPPNQAEMMHNALKEKGIKTALVMFEGEQHGFRKAVNIRRSLDGELQWYGLVWGFKPHGWEQMEPLPVVN